MDKTHATNVSRTGRFSVALAVLGASLLAAGFGTANAAASSTFTRQAETAGKDEFDSESLAPVWFWVNEEPSGWSLLERPGYLEINTSPLATGGKNLLLRSVVQGDFAIETRVLFEPRSNFQFAGLVIYQDQDNFLQLGRAFALNEELCAACVGNAIYFDLFQDKAIVGGNFASRTEVAGEVYLRLELRGRRITAFHSEDGLNWHQLGHHELPPSFLVTGVGLSSSQGYFGTPIAADFDYFLLGPLPHSAQTSSALESQAPLPATPTSTPLPGYIPHRIGVNSDGQFYDRLKDSIFVPRGYNYVRLSPINGTSGQMWEETLNPGFYDPALAEEALRQMHADGYNVVRVEVDCCRPSSNIGSRQDGISPAYIDNVVDFLNKAKAQEIFVLLVLHLTPADGPYNELWYGYDNTKFGGLNLVFLTRGGFDAKAWYHQDFIRALIEREAPLDAIFAYDLGGFFYDEEEPPFTLTSGRIATGNGKTYDMATPEDRHKMKDENLVYWIDEQRAAVLEVDPTALVTQSMRAIGPPSYLGHPHPLWESKADFVDLQVFLGTGSTWEDFAKLLDEASRVQTEGVAEKPVIIGQLAALRTGFPSATSAARALLKWQAASCQKGVDGWLLWLRGSEEHTALYNGLSDGGVINDTLAPANRPDPCLTPGAGESAAGILVYIPPVLASVAVLIFLLSKSKSRGARMGAVAGYVLAAPFALVGSNLSGLLLSQPAGSLVCGLPILLFGTGLGYVLGRQRES